MKVAVFVLLAIVGLTVAVPVSDEAGLEAIMERMYKYMYTY